MWCADTGKKSCYMFERGWLKFWVYIRLWMRYDEECPKDEGALAEDGKHQVIVVVPASGILGVTYRQVLELVFTARLELYPIGRIE